MNELPTLQGKRLTLRPATADDLGAMLEIIQAPGSAEWWGEYEGAEDDEELLSGFVIDLDGDVIGWVGFTEETALKYPSVELDIMLAPAQHGKGYGPEALRAAIDHFIAKGHHRFTIDPSTRNAKAIHAYESAGFKIVGVQRECELQTDGTWGDNYLMDLLARELGEAPS